MKHVEHRSSIGPLAGKRRLSALVAALALCAGTLPLHAGSWIHNNGFTANNNPLPGGASYGSHVAASGTNWDALPGNWGVTGTPDIALNWDGEQGGNSGTGLDTYTAWNGRGNVIQIDSTRGGGAVDGTPFTFITFTPAANVAVYLDSFDLDEWGGGGDMEVE